MLRNFFTVENIYQVIASLLVLFLCLPIHEYAHAWAAKKCGDDTAEMMGRCTLNPIKHLDPMGSLMIILFGFGWAKPVPINPRKFRNYKKDMVFTAAAGPISNLIMGFLCTIIFQIVNSLAQAGIVAYNEGVIILLSILAFMIQINIMLAVFNLLPIPPLDGSNIIGPLLPGKTYRKVNDFIHNNRMVVTIVFIVLVLTGILTIPLTLVTNLIYQLFLWMTTPISLLFTMV